MIRKCLFAAAVIGASAGAANAACSFTSETPIKAIFAAFPAWKAVAASMEECGNIQIELDQEIRTKAPPAFAANPSLYHVGGISNSSIVPLLNAGSIRPLDDLVERFGANLDENQLIKIDGKIMAIAAMVNVEQLFYRTDIFEDLGIEVPQNYEEVLAAAEVIRQANVVDYPFGAMFKADWNIGMEFIGIFYGYGGEFVNDDFTPAVNSEAGLKTLEMLKRISEYLDPEYSVSDATFVQQQMQQGRIAMTNLWVSRAGTMEDPNESQVVGKIGTAASPVVVEGGVPATILYWDGFGIAANITDEEAEVAFRLALEGIDEETVRANNDAVLWLGQAFVPGPSVEGALMSVRNGARPGASAIWNGLIMAAVERNTVAFMTGRKTAEQALRDMEAEYLIAAKEAGIL